MLLRSRLVSTNTKGLAGTATTGARSRGTWAGRGSAAMAACVSAILLVLELTHCRPEALAT